MRECLDHSERDVGAPMDAAANVQGEVGDCFVDPARVLSRATLPALHEGEVHLWPFELRVDDQTLHVCQRLLSAQERLRAERFAFEKDKQRYTVAHGVLRHLLSLYCGMAPHSIEFEHSAGGKPRLVVADRPNATIGQADGETSFNLSHSHDRALIGFSRGREIGVDLEMMREEVDIVALATSCFFGSEIATIRAAPKDQQHAAFFRYWVAKEAVLKGEGIGLGFPLDRFEVTFTGTAERAGYITSSDATQLRSDWTIRMLQLSEGWQAAVAARGEEWIARILPTEASANEG